MNIRTVVKKQINAAQLKRSIYKEHFDKITDYLDTNQILEIADNQLQNLMQITTDSYALNVMEKIRLSLSILSEGPFDTMTRIVRLCNENQEMLSCAQKVAPYSVCGPQNPLLASDYGVPQNRIRVIFIGCRNDQELIPMIPPTVKESEKVSVAEAIGDLDFIQIGAHPLEYDSAFISNFAKTELGSIKTQCGW